MVDLWLIFESVAPIFGIIVVGILLKKSKIVSSEFDLRANQIIFNVALPAIVFYSVATSDLPTLFSFELFAFVQFSIVLSVALSFVFYKTIGKISVAKEQDSGVFIQSTYRSNYAIVGFAALQNLYGEQSLVKGSVILLFIMPTFNLFSIWLLSYYSQKSRLSFKIFAKTILLNPLILALLFALPIAFFNLGLPPVLNKMLHYLGQIALPLALLTMGASLDIAKVKQELRLSLLAVLLKIVIYPAVFTALAIWLGYRDVDLAALMLLYAAPTAMASYTLVRKYDGNETLAAAIIIVSTIMSVITIPLLLSVTKSLGYL